LNYKYPFWRWLAFVSFVIGFFCLPSPNYS